jgi:HK97 family phage major capsid protein
MTTQERVEAQIEEARNEARAYHARITRGNRNPTLDELQELNRLNGRTLTLQRQVADGNFGAAYAQATKGLWSGHEIRGNSIGAQFLRSEAGRWLKENPRRSSSSPWSTPAVDIDIMATTLTESPTSGGKLVVPDYRPGIIPLPLTLPTVRDLLSEGTTTSNLSTYMKETQYTMAAAAVAEGGVKPESTLVFDQVSDEVEVIAHMLPVTNQLLEDEPALRAYIDERLMLGVRVAEDDQLLNGDGVSPNLHGLIPRATAPDVARGTDTNADAIAKQLAAIQNATNLVPTGLVMNPTNWLTTMLAKNTQGDYLSGSGPFAALPVPTLWGRPVAVTNAIVAGTALVVTAPAAMVLQRTPLNIAVSNSHQDYFARNLTALRCEERVTLDVFVPAAFGKVTGLN